MSDTPPDQVLPCGCVLRCVDTGQGQEFQIVPCKLDCQVVRHAMTEAERQGKPVVTRGMP
jgi:hypothetical protein